MSARTTEHGERHLRDFLKSARYLIHTTDMQGRLLWVNETWKHTLGYDEGDVARGLSLLELVAPESSDAEVAKLHAVLAGRDSDVNEEIELCLIAKNGHRVTVAGECDCRVVDGEPVATRAILRDVSEQRAAEARARHVEAQHQAVVDVLDEGIAIISAAATVELLNPAGERILGLRSASVLGRSMLEWPWGMIDEDGGDLPLEAHPALVALHTRRPQAEVILGVRHAGTGDPIWLAVNARPLMRAGRPYAAAVSFRDVTAARAAAMALREREARFRGVLETVRSVAICLDHAGCITFVNDFVLELTGWTRAEVMGINWVDRFVPDTENRALFHAMIASNDVPRHYESDIATRTGERRRIRWDTTLLRDDHGEVVGLASIGQDMSEQVRAARLKNELIAMASHELRTPLTAIRGAIELMRADAASRPERDRMLVGMASRNAERLDRLVSDLMDVERIETGVDTLKPTFVPIDTLLEAAAARTQHRLSQGELTLRLDTDPVELWVDEQRMEQVLVNLIGNAANHAPRGTTVTVTVRDAGDGTEISVHDEGAGIPLEKLESIFEPFVKVDGGETKERGAGLGLFLCRSIVTQHGGRIWAESNGPGTGATVSFVLPKPAGTEMNGES